MTNWVKELNWDVCVCVCVPICVEGEHIFECVFMFEGMLCIPVSIRFWGQE